VRRCLERVRNNDFSPHGTFLSRGAPLSGTDTSGPPYGLRRAASPFPLRLWGLEFITMVLVAALPWWIARVPWPQPACICCGGRSRKDRRQPHALSRDGPCWRLFLRLKAQLCPCSRAAHRGSPIVTPSTRNHGRELSLLVSGRPPTVALPFHGKLQRCRFQGVRRRFSRAFCRARGGSWGTGLPHYAPSPHQRHRARVNADGSGTGLSLHRVLRGGQ